MLTYKHALSFMWICSDNLVLFTWPVAHFTRRAKNVLFELQTENKALCAWLHNTGQSKNVHFVLVTKTFLVALGRKLGVT